MKRGGKQNIRVKLVFLISISAYGDVDGWPQVCNHETHEEVLNKSSSVRLWLRPAVEKTRKHTHQAEKADYYIKNMHVYSLVHKLFGSE